MMVSKFPQCSENSESESHKVVYAFNLIDEQCKHGWGFSKKIWPGTIS